MTRLAPLALAAALLVGPAAAHAATLDSFARCLTRRGATFYGAEWCPHCAKQIDELGRSFRYIDYVECTVEEQRCGAAGVRSYPTWTFADGSRLTGRLSLPHLARKTGCSLREEKRDEPAIIDVPGGAAGVVDLPTESGVEILELP